MAKSNSPVKKPKASTKTVALKSDKKQKVLLGIAVVLFAAAGALFVYRSQAATHVTTLKYSESNDEIKGRFEYFNIPNGKSTVKGLWVKEGWSVMVDDNRVYNLKDKYQACFAVYNTKENVVTFNIYGFDNLGNSGLAGKHRATVKGTNSLKTICVNFRPLEGLNRAMGYEFRPQSGNGVIYKVTVIKL